MSSTFEPLTSFGKANFDAAMKLASRTTECTERLLKQQINATTELVSGNNHNLQTLLNKPRNALESWQSAFQVYWEKALENARCYVAEVLELQAEVLQLIGDQATVNNRNAIRYFEDLTKGAVEEGDNANKTVDHSVKEARAA